MTEVLPIHPFTGRPMAPCPECGRLSGLAGVDGGKCLSCSMPTWREEPLSDVYAYLETRPPQLPRERRQWWRRRG